MTRSRPMPDLIPNLDSACSETPQQLWPPQRLRIRRPLGQQDAARKDCNTINDIDISSIITMESPVARGLLPSFKVKHRYDMGSPTELTLPCRNIYALRDRPEILAIARNSPSHEEGANSPGTATTASTTAA